MANQVNVNTTNNQVTVTQGTTQIITVSAQGPQGIQGPTGVAGPSGSVANTGSFATTGSNIFVGDQIISGSLNITSSFTASGLNYPIVDGIDGSVIVSDGLGNLSMGHGERLVVQVRNNESFTITAGTPLHAVGSVGGSPRVLVVTASSDSSHSNTMPALGIAASDLTPTGDTKDGFAITTGIFPDHNFTLTPGSTTVEEGQILYVGQNGGLTNVKPNTNDQNLVQNVGIVLKTNGTLVQNFQVSSINRTNDVPNLNQGNIFFGSGSNYAKIHISGALDQTVINNITASGNISASGDIVGNNLSGTNTGDQDLSNLVTNSSTASFAITGSNVLFGNITSSGNISASGDINANKITAADEIRLGIAGTVLDASSVAILQNQLVVGGDASIIEIEIGRNTSSNRKIEIYGQITASGAISASGDILANNLSGTNTGDQDLSNLVTNSSTASFAITGSNVLFGNITSSGNISASGDIIGDTIKTNTLQSPDTFLTFDTVLTGSQIRLVGGIANSGINLDNVSGKPILHGNGGFVNIGSSIESTPINLLHNVTASANISASGDIVANKVTADVVDTSFETFLNFEAATAFTFIAPFPLTINFTGSSTSSMGPAGFVTASANTSTFSVQQTPPITLNIFDKLKVTPSASGLFSFSGSRTI